MPDESDTPSITPAEIIDRLLAIADFRLKANRANYGYMGDELIPLSNHLNTLLRVALKKHSEGSHSHTLPQELPSVVQSAQEDHQEEYCRQHS
jgi:hypothetical protein